MALPIPRELMTLDQWEALPEDDSAHYELQEGVLVVSPKPAERHQLAVMRLAAQVERQLPGDWDAVPEFEVVVQGEGPATVRAPDLVVVRADGPENRVEAGDVLVAVEIISPGSRKIDTHRKPFGYSEAGIPHYWVVDVESQTATRELVVHEPFEMRADVDALVDRRPSRSEG